MCGRFTLSTPAAQLVEILQLHSIPTLFPSYNIAPTQQVLCISTDPENAALRIGRQMKWGLIPSWSKDLKIGARMINARSETVAEKPAFRTAFRRRRCLIPADGFFEWQKLSGTKKQPWLISRKDEMPMVFAGIWERWSGGDSEGPVLSCSILTRAANADMGDLHDRMPVILEDSEWGRWLDGTAESPDLLALTQHRPEGLLKAHRVTPAVGRVSFNSPECVEEFTPES